MTRARWVAYIGDAGLFSILAMRAFIDFGLIGATLGAIGLRLQDLIYMVLVSLGDYRVVFQSIIIAVLITMSLGGHFAIEREASRRR